jgi:hypothetical protein
MQTGGTLPQADRQCDSKSLLSPSNIVTTHIPVLRVPQTSISSEWILATGSINSPSNEYLNSVQSFFLTTQDGKSIWLKHPYNLSDKVPFSN